MKKFLALVLALIMTMSLVTISAGAEDFTDADSMNYAEAVEVMSAVGVVGGYADGSFNPQAGLTRGAAAKIICNMILGPTTADALAADAAPYSDVAVDNVFAGYIAYCAKEGIISGYADGTFRPAAPLTGYAFMKMLLGALGYDPAIEGYTGANWSINVAKQALAIELDAGLKGDFAGTKALTREEACLYAFNTMKATMVDYGNKSTISVGDITISTSADAKDVVNNATTETIKNDDKMQFAEKFFSKLTKTSKVADDYARPANTWKYDKDIVGTFVNEEPVAVYVEGFNATELKNLKDEYYISSSIELMLNGYEWTGVSIDDVAARKYTGTVIELYTNDDGDTIDLVVGIQDYFAQVTDEDEDSITLKIYNPWGSPATKVFSDNTKKTDDEFDKLSAAYDEDDYLRVYYEAAGLHYEMIDFADVESVTVKVNTIKVDSAMNGYVTDADGAKYTFASGYMNNTALTVGDEYKLFLDANGYVIGSELVKAEAAALTDVYFVDAVYTKTANVAGVTETTYYAQLVALDGTVTEVALEDLDKNDKTGTYSDYALKLVTISDKKWTNASVTYKGGDEKYDLKVWDEHDSDDYAWDLDEAVTFTGKKFEKNSTRIVGNTGTYRLNNETVYVFVEGSQNTLDVDVYTGGVAYTWASGDVAKVIVKHDTMVAAYVIIDAVNSDQAQTYSEDAIFIVSDSTEKGDGYRVQEVIKADGSKVTMNIAEAEYPTAPAVLAGNFYTYDVNEDGYYVLEDATLIASGSYVWDEQEGAIEGATLAANALYNDLLTVGTIEDIDVANAAFVDAHDTTVSTQYDKTVSSLADLCDLVDDSKVGTVTLSLNVSDEGAVVIIVTSIVKA